MATLLHRPTSALLEHYLVVGAGVAGIASVGRLLENLDVKKSKISWIDPQFCCGRMGAFYQRVPANTLNGDLVAAFKLCDSFDWDFHQQKRLEQGIDAMIELKPDECYPLSSFVAALEDSQLSMLSRVNSYVGKVTGLSKTSRNDKWTVEITSKCPTTHTSRFETIACDAIIYACGAQPIIPHRSSEFKLHEMDLMVDPIYVQKLIEANPTIASAPFVVVGGSHSAMLIVMNMIENGFSNVINIYRSELRFMHITEDGYVKYPGTGLKGPVGAWVKNNISSCERLRRIR